MALLYFFVVVGGKQKPKKASSTRSRTDVVENNSALNSSRSLQDWQSMSREALVLACKALNIVASGTQLDLRVPPPYRHRRR